MRDIKTVKVIMIMTLIMIFSGCYDANEPNDYAYVVGLGIDKAEEDGEYLISIQYAKPTEISGGSSEEGGSGGETLGLVTVEAPTLYSGISIANNLVSKRFQLSHTKIIVISEQLAQEGISDIMYTVMRSTDLRPNMYIAIARGDAREYFASVQPQMEINPVKFYQLIFENKAAELVPKNISQNVYFYVNSSERDVVLPLVSKSKEAENINESENEGHKTNGETQEENIDPPKTDAAVNYESFQYLMKEYIAGDISAGKKNKSEAMGMAVFSNDKMIAEMNGIESELYNILTGKFRYSYDSFKSEDFPNDTIVMLIEQHGTPSVSVKVDDTAHISVRTELEASVISAPNEYLPEENIYKLENELEGDIKAALEKFLYKTSTELNADILGFGGYAKRRFSDYGEFERYDWKSRYAEAEFDVEVKLNIRRTGLIIRKEGDIK